MLPHRCVDDAGVAGIHREIGGTGRVIDLKHRLPGLTTVAAPIDTALFARPPDLSLHSDVNQIGVVRMDNHTGNLPGLGQPDMGPGLTGIGGLVHAITMTGGYAPDGRLARANVDNILVGLSHCYGTDGPDVKKAIRDIVPGNTRVLGFPDTTTGSTHVIGAIVAQNARHSRHATTTPGANLAPRHPVEKTRVYLWLCLRGHS